MMNFKLNYIKIKIIFKLRAFNKLEKNKTLISYFL
jgi:hypothetical protein